MFYISYIKTIPLGKYIEQTWIGLCNDTLTATACTFVFKGIRLCGTLLLTTIDEPPEALSPAWWIWLNRVQPLMFELSVGFKNVSWRHMMEGHRPLSNKSNSLKLAFKPRQFHGINLLVMVQWWLSMGLGTLRFWSLQRILPTVLRRLRWGGRWWCPTLHRLFSHKNRKTIFWVGFLQLNPLTRSGALP